VGVEFRTKGRAGRLERLVRTITAGAQAARDHATSVAASSLSLSSSSSSSSSLPADSPGFQFEESLDELRSLALSAGAQIAGEFKQRRIGQILPL